jgi:hypothetical protein
LNNRLNFKKLQSIAHHNETFIPSGVIQSSQT